MKRSTFILNEWQIVARVTVVERLFRHLYSTPVRRTQAETDQWHLKSPWNIRKVIETWSKNPRSLQSTDPLYTLYYSIIWHA